MRNVVIAISVLLLLSCHQPNPYESYNLPPNTPITIFPSNDTTNISINVSLQWSGGDPNETDVIKFDVYLGASDTSLTLVSANLVENKYQAASLKYSTKYYWQIIAKDKFGLQTSSPIWSFTTRREFNNSPFVPGNPYPANNSTEVDIHNIMLRWQGGDPDSADLVYYDVYLGTTSPPYQLLTSNQTDSTYALPLLEYNRQYFWRIAAKDIFGSETDGPIWNFTTKAAAAYVSENFDDYVVGAPPPDTAWTFYGDNGNLFVTDAVFFGTSGKSCQFIDPSDTNSSVLSRTLPQKSVGILEFAIRVDRSDDYLGVRLYAGGVDDDHLGPQISIRGDSLQYYDHTRNWQYITDIDTTRWYQIRLSFDCSNQVYSIYVDDELKVNNATWRGTSVPFLKYLYFMTFNNQTCSGGYVDEIYYYSGELMSNF